MLKQNISWTGHDDRPANKTLYFNLTRFEVAHDMELEVLEERLTRFRDEVIGPDDKPTRPLTQPEVREMLDIVKILIKHSYGVRSLDGKRFQKSEDIWEEFVEIGAFDAFIFSLFEGNAEGANNFMANIWPKEMREAAEVVRRDRPNIHPVEDVQEPGNVGAESPVAPDDSVPSITSAPELHSVINTKEWWEYEDQELLDLSDKDFEILVAESSRGKNVPPKLLVMRQQRRQLDTPPDQG